MLFGNKPRRHAAVSTKTDRVTSISFFQGGAIFYSRSLFPVSLQDKRIILSLVARRGDHAVLPNAETVPSLLLTNSDLIFIVIYSRTSLNLIEFQREV